MRFLALPSPSQGVWYLGPIPIRAYGLIIACAILIAVYWAARRYETRGGDRELFYDIALWAVPGGIIGARVYHVITSPDAYFGKNGNPIMALAIWNGGLGIWGAVAGGALAVWLVARHRGQRLGPIADSLAVPLLAAVEDDDAVEGLELLAHALEANLDCHLVELLVLEGVARAGPRWGQATDSGESRDWDEVGERDRRTSEYRRAFCQTGASTGEPAAGPVRSGPCEIAHSRVGTRPRPVLCRCV